MAPSVILVGGGGHALVVAEAALLAGLSLAGFLDDAAAAALGAGDPAAKRLGPLADAGRVIGAAPEGTGWILAVGGLELRRRLLARLGERGARARSIVHPEAWVSPSARMGRGVYIGPRAVVHTRANIGDHAVINSGAVIEHECVIGENAHVAPGAVLGGGCRVGTDALVGIRACALPGLSIGARCTIGAGSVVIESVPEGVTVVGAPARALAAAR